MTSLALLASVFCAAGGGSQARAAILRRVGLLPQSSDLGSMRIELKMVTPSLGYVVQGGDVWRTRNGGRDWKFLRLPEALRPPHAEIWTSCFDGSGNGWVLEGGSGRVGVTHDQGNSWRLLPLPVSKRQALLLTVFRLPGGQAGWVGGGEWVPAPRSWRSFPSWAIDVRPSGTRVSRPLLFFTPDGGASWERQELPAGLGYCVRQVRFVDRKVGIAEAEQGVAVTTDGGQTWRTAIGEDRISLERHAYTVTLVDADTIWASVEGGRLYRTEKGGACRSVLKRMPNPIPGIGRALPIDLKFWSAQEGLAVDEGRKRLFQTKDGGETWKMLFPDVEIEFFSAPDRSHVWALGGRMLFRVEGLQWSSQ